MIAPSLAKSARSRAADPLFAGIYPDGGLSFKPQETERSCFSADAVSRRFL